MIRVLITDDYALIRRGLKEVLQKGLGAVTVGEAQNAEEALAQIMRNKWDIVLLDISMPGRSGLDILPEIKLAQPDLPVLILSMHPADQLAVCALKSGAAGFISKGSPPEELIKAIRTVLEGGRMITADLGGGTDKPLRQMLSNREFQVFQLLASGQAPGQIAQQLGLSIKTVSTYRTRLLEKMGLQNNAQLIRYAMQQEHSQ